MVGEYVTRMLAADYIYSTALYLSILLNAEQMRATLPEASLEVLHSEPV